MTKKKLTLKRRTLASLSTEDLTEVAGASARNVASDCLPCGKSNNYCPEPTDSCNSCDPFSCTPGCTDTCGYSCGGTCTCNPTCDGNTCPETCGYGCTDNNAGC